jgi:hypothetical protein
VDWGSSWVTCLLVEVLVADSSSMHQGRGSAIRYGKLDTGDAPYFAYTGY